MRAAYPLYPTSHDRFNTLRLEDLRTKFLETLSYTAPFLGFVLVWTVVFLLVLR